MKDSDTSAQLPLSATQNKGAEIVKLPSPDRSDARHSQPGSSDDGELITSSEPRRRYLWYALYFPQLNALSKVQEARVLSELARLVESVSSTVNFHPQALVCEIRSSLKYFGGVDSIHNKLKSLITPALEERKLGDYFFYSASPTVSSSLLLARSGQNILVYQKENLRSALGQLSTDVLSLDKEQGRRLYSMGVRKIRDIWRLPPDGLHKRFGSDFVTLLGKALGIVPEPTRNYVAPPAFATAYDLPYEIENLDRLLPIIDEMLLRLCNFLRKRDLSASYLVLSLIHEQRGRTEVDMGLRQPSRSPDHLLSLIETHFSNLIVPAPIIGLKLRVKQFDAFISNSDSLLIEERTDRRSDSIGDKNLDQFMEQLHARLGGDALKSINTAAEHCPEYAAQQLNYEDSKAQTPAAGVASNPRPFWLLGEPVQLTQKGKRLYHRQVITLVSGPERIETYWWSGQDILRDYYIARERNGSRLWVFRERSGERNWFLHGYFS